MAGRPEGQPDAGPRHKPLDLEAARAAILDDVAVLPETETLEIKAALDRVLTELRGQGGRPGGYLPGATLAKDDRVGYLPFCGC